jgi:Uma2 family endonuclease
MRTAALISAEDFALIAHVLGPCELVKGEIIPTSPGGVRHSRVSGNAYWILESHCRTRDIGRVLTNEAGVIVARRPDTVRGADVAYISYARLPKGGPLPTGFLQQPPELVIEVLGEATSWEKMEEKVADYHGLGVDLVWVLDPQTLSLRVYERDRAPRLIRDTETASADPYVPGFSSQVSAFFQD